MGLSKKQLSFIKGLQQKKNRQRNQLFIAEGIKVVNELLNSSLVVEQLFVLDGYQNSFSSDKITCISNDELKRISSLKTPNVVLGVFRIPQEKEVKTNGIVLALEGVNDPGNLGTIIRLCDWFGIQQIVCSENTVDCYNQKVVQSTMGSITRVQINYINLIDYIKSNNNLVFAADMQGENIYEADLPESCVLIMGNEANGISEEINQIVDKQITIPRFGDLKQTESLNVATATAILLSEFRRG